MKSLESKERGLSTDEAIILNLVNQAPAITRITSTYLSKFTALGIDDIETILKSLERRQLIEYNHGEWELR